jgi:hypothetical protein
MLSSVVYIHVDHCSTGCAPKMIAPSLKFLHLSRISKPFRINTCESLSKQTTSTLIRINTYEKQEGGEVTSSLTGSGAMVSQAWAAKRGPQA